MKVHFAAASATSVSMDAIDTVDFGSATVLWDAPGVILLKLLAIGSLVALNGFFGASEFAIVKVRASQLVRPGRPRQWARPARPTRDHPPRRLSFGNPARYHLS
jgi:hypothetical protein